jgi:hypothetical protein
MSHVSSPKTPSILQHQSPSSKLILPIVPSILSTSAPPHFTYPVSTTNLPVLQYSAIVSQNTVPLTSTTTISSNSTISKQQHVLSPPTKQQTRQLPNGTGAIPNTHDSTVITTSSLPISSVTSTVTNSSNSSHPPSLLSTNNDRTGIYLETTCVLIYTKSEKRSLL